MKSINLFSFTVLLSISVMSSVFAFESRAAEDRKLVVVIADNVSFRDWATGTFSYLRSLESQGAVGLMVTRTAASFDSDTAPMVTLSAGVPARGRSEGALAYDTNELYLNRTAGEIFALRTGLTAKTPGVVNPGVNFLINSNLSTEWHARPGALGSLLHDNGICRAVVGNSDYLDHDNRAASIIAMDENGVVPFGNVSKDILVDDRKAPDGWTTNQSLLKKKFIEYYSKCNFIVVDVGETTRADRFGEAASSTSFQEEKLKALKQLQEFLRQIVPNLDLNTTQIIVMSPSPPSGAAAIKETLTPVFAFGNGIPKGPALLSSESTKRPGLVRNTDFTVHVCNYFGISPATDFIGSPLTSIANSQPIPFLIKMFERDAFVELHYNLLKYVIIWHLLLLLVCFLTTLRMELSPKWWLRTLTKLLLFTTPMFLSFLLIAGLPQLNFEPVFTICFFVFSIAIGLVVGFIPRNQYKLLAMSCLYVGVIVADQLAGANLVKNSVLGYGMQNGSRFYGIGNEYSGFLIGAPLIVFGVLLDNTHRSQTFLKVIMIILLVGVMFVVGAPFLGAEFGNMAAMAFAFTTMLLLIQGKTFNWKTVALSMAAVVAIVVIVEMGEMFHHASESHIGALCGRIAGGGGRAEFMKIIGRKLKMNVHLLQVSFWSALFASLVAITLSFYYFPIKRIKKIFLHHKFLRLAYLSTLCGSIITFLLNDSGIVPGATALLLPTAGILLFLFNYDMPEEETSEANFDMPVDV